MNPRFEILIQHIYSLRNIAYHTIVCVCYTVITCRYSIT